MKLIRIAVDNPVAVTILMFVIIGFGILEGLTIVREFFPSVKLDRIVISTPYPGATPEEVERALLTKVESAIESVNGIEEITSQALENFGLVIAKVDTSRDPEKIAEDMRIEIDRIRDLPPEVEESVVEVLEQQVPVISVTLYGSVSERRLKILAEDVKDELMTSPLISRVIVSGTRPEQISIEVEPQLLEAYGLTLDEVGRAVRNNNVDLAAGEIKADTGKVVVRTLGETQQGLPMESLVVRGDVQEGVVRLSDIANVIDGFEETPLRGTFQGQRAVQVTVFKRGEEDAIRISRYVKEYIEEKRTEFAGEAINIAYRTDLAKFIEQRIELLSRNAFQGLVLVFICLGLFMSARMAFWVGVGLVVSFMGTFVVMDIFGATINLISLFGLIIVLGMLVDDAIVVAENIYAKMEEGLAPHRAAVEGAEEVFRPVLATVLTTMVAFAPLGFIDGVLGDFLSVLPIVVIAALVLSLVESFLMLPSHLAEFGQIKPKKKSSREPGPLRRAYRRISDAAHWLQTEILERRMTEWYIWTLKLALNWRYVTIAVAITISLFTFSLIRAGLLPFVLFQKVDADTIVAEVEMSSGTSAEETEEVLKHISAIALQFPETVSVYSVVGFREEAELQNISDPATIGEVIVELTEETRTRSSDDIINEWREKTGAVPGAVGLKFRDRAGGPPGPEIEIKVRGPEEPIIEAAVRHIRETMANYVGVRDIEDDGGSGKMELQVRMKETARALGISQEEIARQVRNAFFGFEAQVLQRNREEVEVWVRLDEESRKSIGELMRLRVQTPTGERVPLGEIAEITQTRGITRITRIEGERTVTITADVDFDLANTNEVTAKLEQEFRDIGNQFRGVSISFEGAKKETSDSLGSLAIGFPVAITLIYCILAILFKSYIQPLIVMVAIPYGIIGAMLGHLVYGLIPGLERMPITFLSLIGMVGLSGIVVNDSLILVTFINTYRREHPGQLFDAVVQAGRRRFRPILLTSLTTVLGLAPLLTETSFQAQFLIPMAISISFGLALATVLTLLLLPCLYMVNEDLRTFVHWLRTGRWEVVRLKPAEYLRQEMEG